MPTDPFCCVKACEQGPAEQNTREHGEDAGVKRTQDLTMRIFGPTDLTMRSSGRTPAYWSTQGLQTAWKTPFSPYLLDVI